MAFVAPPNAGFIQRPPPAGPCDGLEQRLRVSVPHRRFQLLQALVAVHGSRFYQFKVEALGHINAAKSPENVARAWIFAGDCLASASVNKPVRRSPRNSSAINFVFLLSLGQLRFHNQSFGDNLNQKAPPRLEHGRRAFVMYFRREAHAQPTRNTRTRSASHREKTSSRWLQFAGFRVSLWRIFAAYIARDVEVAERQTLATVSDQPRTALTSVDVSSSQACTKNPAEAGFLHSGCVRSSRHRYEAYQGLGRTKYRRDRRRNLVHALIPARRGKKSERRTTNKSCSNVSSGSGGCSGDHSIPICRSCRR